MGWQIYPAGNLEDWDGMLSWFIHFVQGHPKQFEADNELNNAVNDWYKACRSLNLI